jgi:hypothetical protein
MGVNYSDLTPGTPLTWMNVGGDFAMNLKALATAGIREGGKSATLIDGTKGMPEALEVIAQTKLQAAPSAGNECPIFLAFSKNATAGSENPGGLTGVDAAVANADRLPQLDVFCGAIILSNDIGTGVQLKRFWVVPLAEYLIPVFQNSSGQTTSNVDGETSITIRPWYRRNPIA